MKQAKRITLLLLVLVLILVFGTVRAEAVEVLRAGTCGEDLTWVLTDDGTLTISGTGEMENYSLQNRSPWYRSGSIQNVVIQDGVTSIGDEAFLNCWNLTSIDFPDGLTSIGDSAFKGCDSYLTSIDLPDGLTSIGDSAFSGCDNLTRIDLPDGLASIGDAAFYDCGSLTSIELPAGLSSIGNYIFLNCGSLQRITVSGNNMHYSSDETGVLFNKDKTELVAAPGALQTYSVPAGVTYIRDTAFTGCDNLTSIELPDGLISIGDVAFEFCGSLTSIDFPDGLASIGDYAFQCCDSLTRITFCGDVPSISGCAFEDVTVTAFYPAAHPAWTKAVRQNYGGRITWIPYGEGTQIASGWSGATQWSLSDAGVLTFSGNGNMKNYDWAGGQPWAKYADQITYIVIEDGVTAVGSGAFKDFTKVESVALPGSGLKTIGEAAFYGCSALEEIYIPDGVYTIWEYTFKNCTSLETVRLPNTLIKIDQGAFENCTALDDVFVPSNTEIIGSWSFKGCTGLQEVEMQLADATKIREGAFKNCSALKKIHLPEDIQILGDSCFYGIGATSFTIPETVTSIEAWCFARAYSLKEITFEGDAPTIGEGAFNKITLTAKYPAGNATWTDSVKQNYGGMITWKAN